MHITWDEEKNRKNKAKHKLSFETAQLVFSDPLQVNIQDRHEEGEERWQTIGCVFGVVLIVVPHTWHVGESEEMRIISARKADAHERKRYEKDTY